MGIGLMEVKLLKQTLLLLVLAPLLVAAEKQLAVLQQDSGDNMKNIVGREIFFTLHQKKVLGQDFPIRDLALSQHRLWLLGYRHVWHFDLNSQKLRKYTFALEPEALANAFLAREETERAIYFATTQTLFKLQQQPQLIKRLPQRISSIVAFSALPTAFVWFAETGVYFLQRPSQRLWRVPYRVQRGDVALAAPNLDALWLVRDKQLLRVAGENWQAETILTSPNLVLGGNGKSLFIGRGDAVLHYSWRGQLAQVIPVAHQRQLRAMHIGPRGHSYIFADGLLEYYRTNEKAILKTKLKLSPRTKLSHLDVLGSRLAFIDDGMVRVFVLKSSKP